jgi:signal transduction histidine kinase
VNFIRAFINRCIGATQYDAGQTLSDYSKSISNILEMDLLATVVVGHISAAMRVTHGALVTVSCVPTENHSDEKDRSFVLRPINGLGQRLSEGRLSERNALAYFLGREHQPLTQYDIDLLPRFREMDPGERAWINSLKMDVFVPVYAKDDWIGILALGQKESGDRYFDEDLLLLETLADQTAVALENARLFQDLKQRNAENERLNQELTSANANLARLDQSKSDFISIASHELRTPLTQIIGYHDILDEMMKDGETAPETGRQMTGYARKAARRLEEIVETMFDVSLLDTNTLELEPEPVSLAAIISAAASHWHEGLVERRLTLTVSGLANLPPLLADSKRLGQVFSQLLQNAIKSTPDGGQIAIVGRCVEDGQNTGDQVEITVADTGIGIAAQDLERIFEKFCTGGNLLRHSTGSTKFKGGGPGLGLTIARGIVEKHGGRIWAESPGYNEETCPGTKLHVLLPV